MRMEKCAGLMLGAFLALTATSAFQAPAVLAQSPQQHYSTYSSKVGELLANSATRAVLEKHFPGISKEFRMKMVKGKTFRQLHEMAPVQLPAAKLDAVDRDLQAVQP